MAKLERLTRQDLIRRIHVYWATVGDFQDRVKDLEDRIAELEVCEAHILKMYGIEDVPYGESEF